MGLPMEPGGDEFALATAYEGKGRKRAIGFLLHNNIVNKTLVDVSISMRLGYTLIFKIK